MLMDSHVLVADDEKNGRRMLEILLSKLGCKVSTVQDGVEALEILGKSPVDLIISDLKMPRLDGLGLLGELSQSCKNIPFIMVTSYGCVESAVTAMKYGAFDFITRPFNIDQIEMAVKKALNSNKEAKKSQSLCEQSQSYNGEVFVGESPAMRLVYGLIRNAAPSLANVFITGETGTGKELVARAVHEYSGRKGLFVPINCAALSTSVAESELFGHVRGAFTGADKDRIGKFEFAHQGTLFLDEITEMHPDLQAKLLRVLQDNRIERVGSNRSIDIDIRIIAATNRNIAQAIEEGYLRNDIYYRLNVINIAVPPLNERREDILLLADYFIKQYKDKVGHVKDIKLSTAAKEFMLNYYWPGNVRELQNAIERAVILCQNGLIDVEHLSFETGIISSENRSQYPVADETHLESHVAILEKEMINNALRAAKGNKAMAARILKISERTFWYKLKKYNISGKSL